MRRSRRWITAGILALALLVPLNAAPPHLAVAASTLAVTTAADLAPPCVAAAFSLRCAITQANADGVGDTITFHIASTAVGCTAAPVVCTLQPLRALPPLTASNTIVDGYSQPGATPNTNALGAGDNAVLTIALDGSTAGRGVDGLDITGANDTVRGLSITGFITCFAPSPACHGVPGSQSGGSAVGVSGSGDIVAGNFLGVAPDGVTAAPNQFAGVHIISVGPPANNALIGGTTPAASNVLSGNKQCTGGDCEGFGVYVDTNSGSGAVIARNYIGTTASGAAALGNAATAVVILAPHTTLGSTTRGSGNVISGNGGDAVLIGAAGVLIAGNRIGTNAAGTAAVGNHSHGIDAQAANTIIRDNVVSANGDTGVVLLFAGNVVQGNRIGTNAAGTTALGNGLHPSAIFLGEPINGTDGLVACSGPNTIGGTAAGAGNLVSGNAGDGISLVSSGNVVQGNTVGANAAGTAALPNGVDGIGSRSDGLKGSGFCAQAANNGGDNNTIGGAAAGAGNLVGGNAGDGVVVLGTANTVAGNRIGVAAAGAAPLGNGGDGVLLTGTCADNVCQVSSNNTIGGAAGGAGNVVGANAGNGVHIDGTGGGTGNTVQGNSIGATAGGTVALGNHANGVLLANGAVDDTVGGTAPGAGNIIADNAQSGVLIGASSAETTTHSAVQQNAIFANGGLGIDLAPQGTVNCTTPAPGPNDYTACPVIQSATTAQVGGTACAGCTVEAFIATGEADDQGHGEGQTFLGRATADGTGAWRLPLAAGQVATGQRVTATATTPAAFGAAAETSEFAANRTVN